MRRVWWSIALGVALAGCDAPLDDRGPCGLTREVLEIDGQRGLLLLPPGLDDDAGAPLVIYHHGRGEDWDTIEAGLLAPQFSCALGASGYMVASSHAHGDNWGSEPAIADYVALYATIAARRRVRGVMFISVSMGGLTGLVTLGRGLIPDVRAWAGIYPVTNLGHVYFDDDRYSRQIERAYDGHPAPEQDPMTIDPAAFRGVPMLIWASPEDTRVSTADNTERFLERLGHPSTARWIVTKGEHGDPSNFDPEAMIHFFDAQRHDDRTR
jgi:hypothetical protein